MVLAGCEGEVHMYSLFVDDSGQVGQEAVATARRALAQGEPLPQVTHSLHLSVLGCKLAASISLMQECLCSLSMEGWRGDFQ